MGREGGFRVSAPGHWFNHLVRASASTSVMKPVVRTWLRLSPRVRDAVRLGSHPERSSSSAARGPAVFVSAWHDLAEHPALLWVPPVWRSENFRPQCLSPVEMRHAVRAVDRNLIVHVRGEATPYVELIVAPLADRVIGDRVDPTTPVVANEPRLSARATSFEDAVIALRAEVFHALGDPQDWARFPNEAATRDTDQGTEAAGLRSVPRPADGLGRR